MSKTLNDIQRRVYYGLLPILLLVIAIGTFVLPLFEANINGYEPTHVKVYLFGYELNNNYVTTLSTGVFISDINELLLIQTTYSVQYWQITCILSAFFLFTSFTIIVIWCVNITILSSNINVKLSFVPIMFGSLYLIFFILLSNNMRIILDRHSSVIQVLTLGSLIYTVIVLLLLILVVNIIITRVSHIKQP